MGRLLGVAMCDAEIREVPKLLLNFEEVCFCYGSPQLATDLRNIEALVPAKKSGRVLLFERGHVEDVCRRFVAGEFDGQLAGERRRSK